MRSVGFPKSNNKKVVRNVLVISTALLFSACSPLSNRFDGSAKSDPVYPLAASFVTSSASPVTKSKKGSSRRVTSSSLAPVESDVAYQTATSSEPTPAKGTVIVRSGDTLLGVARKQNVDAVDLAELNGIEAPYDLQVGDELVLPGSKFARKNELKRKSQARLAVRENETPKNKTLKTVAAQPHKTKKIKTAQADPHKKETSRKKVAAVEVKKKAVQKPVKTASAEKPVTKKKPALKRASVKQVASAGNSFRWPIRGRVISEFGAKPNGTRNDGINLSVPKGAAIVAAEDGEVVYSGNELKGFGNLVLIRHKNGWSTAYAHISVMLVKKGQKVKRGQVIAKAGQTGAVSRPQLHFEIRRGTTPVNPRSFLSGSRLALRQ